MERNQRVDGPILQLGDGRLQRLATPVLLDSPGLPGLIESLMARAIATQGVGIAAPQLGISQRLFIVASHPNARYPDAPEMEPTAMLNPVLIDRSDRETLGWEGCLSVPNCRAQVSRAHEIRVEYFDQKGALQRSQLSGFIARIFQHELDHLNGILFVDRVEAAACISEAEYQAELKSS